MSRARSERPRFGDEIESRHASDDNPQKFGTFVEVVKIPQGRMNAGTHYRCTDRKGTFWLVPEINAEVRR